MADCSPSALLEASKCFRCLPRGLLFSVRTDLLCQWANKQPEGCSEAVVDTWLAEIDAAFPGLSPTQNTIDAVCVFIRTLRTNGILDKFYYINPIVYDANTATDGNFGKNVMLYPVVHLAPVPTPSTLILGNENFLDLTLDGVQQILSEETAVYIDTGFVCSDFFGLFIVQGGESLYQSDYDYVFNVQIDIGVWDFADTETDFSLSANVIGPNQCSFDLSVNGGSFAALARPEQLGFYSGSRTDDTHIDLYGPDSNPPFGTMLLNEGNIPCGILLSPPIPIYLLGRSQTGFPDYPSFKRFSFFAIHDALTEAETIILSDAVQTMRVAFGGGWV